MRKQETHYYWLDLIRFIAAFLVLACHFRGAFFVDYTSLPIHQQNILTFVFYSLTRLGHEAVLIFFVLSGFLVGGGTIRKLQNNTFDIKSYTIDRFVRIMLPLVSALLLFAMTNTLMHNSIDWRAWIGNLFSLQGITTYSIIEPLWSLSYEVWFYVLAGAIAVIFFNPNRSSYLYSAIAILIVSIIFTKLAPRYLFVWLMGALAYITVPHKKNNLLLFGASIMSIVFIILLQLSSGSKFSMISLGLSRYSIELIFSFFFCLLLQQLILVEPKGLWLKRVNWFGTKAAAFSYTLYLTHVVVLRVLEYIKFPKSSVLQAKSIILYISELTIAIIIAYMVYWCFEKRTYSVKKWIKDKLIILEK